MRIRLYETSTLVYSFGDLLAVSISRPAFLPNHLAITAAVPAFGFRGGRRVCLYPRVVYAAGEGVALNGIILTIQKDYTSFPFSMRLIRYENTHILLLAAA